MRPKLEAEIIDRALWPRVDRLAETKVPCPAPTCDEAPDVLCPLCEGTGLVSIQQRADWRRAATEEKTK